MVTLTAHYFSEIILFQGLLYVILAIYSFFLLLSFYAFLFLYLYSNLVRCQSFKPFLLLGRVILLFFGVLISIKIESISNIIDEVLKLFIILMSFLQWLYKLYISHILTNWPLVLKLIFVNLHLALCYLLLRHFFALFILLLLTFLIFFFLLFLMFFHFTSDSFLFRVIFIQLIVLL